MKVYTTKSKYDGTTIEVYNNNHNKLFEISYKWRRYHAGLIFYPTDIDIDHPVLNISFLFFTIFIHLPFRKKNNTYSAVYDENAYGFRFYDFDTYNFFPEYLRLSWGPTSKSYDMPWTIDPQYNEYTTKGGEINYRLVNHKQYYKDVLPINKITDKFLEFDFFEYKTIDSIPFAVNEETAILKVIDKNGKEVNQETKIRWVIYNIVTAPCWFWQLAHELGLNSKIKRIALEFDKPIGDNSTWKGGTWSICKLYDDNKSLFDNIYEDLNYVGSKK